MAKGLRRQIEAALLQSDEDHGTYTILFNNRRKQIGCMCKCGYKIINNNHETRRTLRKHHRAKMAAEAVARLEKA